MTREDFGDWMSPILVKEFRQGLRSRLFVYAFLGIQVAMAIGLALAVAGAGLDAMRSFGSGLFWTCIGVPLGLLWPVASLSAINAERRRDTLELLLLSRLTPRRVVVGKWFALFAQAALLAVAVLPYLFFRYFLGGIDLAGEFGTLALLLAGCALGTLFGVALSAYLNAAGVAVLSVLFIVGPQVLWGVAAFSMAYGGVSVSGPVWTSWPTIVTGGIYALLLGLLFVEAGAAKIAPEGLRYSPRSRLCAVGLLLAWLGAGVYFRAFPSGAHLDQIARILSIALLVIICLLAMLPSLPRSPAPFLKFARLGPVGRLLGLFFGPGWPAGIFFSVAMVFAVAAGEGAKHLDHDELLTLTTLAGALFTTAIARRISARTRFPAMGPWIWFCAQATATPFFSYLLDTRWKQGLPVATALLPFSEFFLSLTGQIPGRNFTAHLTMSVVVLIASVVASVVMACIGLIRARALHREAERAWQANRESRA